jgi:hypothetical protein
MRGLVVLSLIAGTAFPALAQSDGDMRLRQARQECWAQVGVYGDPYKSRGSMAHVETVKTCVRGKMAGGGGQKPRR